MITPVLITSIGWGTYLFFAALNALFFPIIYFFYPETAGRSLEEIDLIFAKGHKENISYVKAAKELPHMTDAEVERYARDMGFSTDSSDEESGEFKEDRAEKEEDMLADRANRSTY
jgi:hypothetical protein